MSIVSMMPSNHPLSPASPPTFNLSQHQSLFQWVGFSHQVAKVSCAVAKVLGLVLDFPGIQQRDWGSPGNLTLKASGIWLQNFHRTRGNRDASRAQIKPCVHQNSGERSRESTGDWSRPASECLRVSCGSMGRQWSASETGAQAATVLEGTCCHKTSWKLPTIDPVDSRTGSPQDKQLTEREQSPTHQQTIGLKYDD